MFNMFKGNAFQMGNHVELILDEDIDAIIASEGSPENPNGKETKHMKKISKNNGEPKNASIIKGESGRSFR